MKKLSYTLLLLYSIFLSFNAISAGGTTPAAALLVPITLPFYNSAGQTTAGNDVNNPAGFVSAYTTGFDWFYYVCPTSTGNITTTISYTPTSGGLSPSISIWNGVPGSGGTLVNSITSPGDLTVDGVLSIESSVTAGTCYYIMIDNWPTPNGFTYDISVYLSPINAACTNMGFESNNFSGWTGTTGIVTPGVSTDPYPVYEPTGFTTSTTQHAIMTTGNDPVVGAALPRVCPSLTTRSMRLGDGTGTSAKGASIEQKFNVTASNALFTYYYAVVFEDDGHYAYEQPIFRVDVLDCSGNNVTCGDYLVVASAGAAGFVNVPGTITYYKPWTPVFLDLTQYIGSCITIRFITGDCSRGGHYGYAYIDAVCNPLQITGSSTICAGSSTVLTAPSGAASYAWNIQGSTAVIGTSQTITVSPLVTTTYECKLVSVTGCQTVITATPVTVNPLPTITGNLSGCILANSQLTGSATPDPIAPWTSSNTAVATISSTGLVSGLTAGTTTITYKNSNGCIITALFTVYANPTITGTLTACINGTSQLTGSATANSTNPWTSSNTAVATVSSTGLVTGVSAGTSTITYLNSNGCSITSTFTINPNPTITGTLSVCLLATSQLTGSATANTTAPWTSSNPAVASISSTGLVTSLSVGTTTITYKNTNGCSEVATFTVNPNPTIIGTLSACIGATSQLTGSATPDGSTPWTSSNAAVATITSTGLVSGVTADTSTITYKNSFGCTVTAIFTVNPDPTITGTLSSCVGATSQLTGSLSANATNPWTSSSTANATISSTGLVTGSTAGSSTITYQNTLGCSTTATFVVTSNPNITNPGPQTACDSYTLPTIVGTDLTGNQNYYNNSQALGGTVITGPITSTQTVWIYDAQGLCNDEESFVVTIVISPIISNNPGSLSICSSYPLPVILGTNLTGNQNYYNNSQALGGSILTGPISSTQTVWIYDINGTCKDEESYLVTINTTPPAITNPGPQVVCNSYTLPTIVGTNLTGNQKYYNNSQALGGTVITGPITSTQTVWIYDIMGNCSDEESFLVTVIISPIITNPGNQVVCDTYTLPTIVGTNLSGTENYYNNSQALGGTVITGPITSTQTVWIYDASGICSDEESFLVTVNQTPIITNPGNQTACDSYTLPTIAGTNLSGTQKYYNNSQALGGTVITGPITSTQTVWIFDTEGGCSDEESFLVTINQTPIITNPGNQTVCDSYTLPTITGTNLTGNENYYNNSQALGGTVITGPITSTQTVWIFDTEGTCSDEESFLVTVNNTPTITNPGNQTACDSYTLPTITGTNLTGNENYYNNSQALGGTVITGPITSTQTVWIFDTEGSCSDEESFLVTVNQTPIITNPGNQTACDSYTLPAISGTDLTGNENYYNDSQALGGTVITGPITSTQTVWIFDTEGACSDEESFVVTINQTPIITNPGNQTACDSYTLPVITGTNLTGNENYYNNSQALGGTVIAGPITSTQTVWIFDTEGSCSDEESFLVTVNNTPTITNPVPQIVCGSYSLPLIVGTNLSGTENYYNNSQALGGTVITGPITSTQTVWIYDTEGTCSDEESFLVTVNQTPKITNPGNQTACDSYTLPNITGTNLTGNENYYNNSQALGGTIITGPITSTQTVWIYDTEGTCSDEESFLVTVNNTPTITNPGNQTACDSYTLPTITGTNLTGNENYYNNSQALGGTVITGPITSTQTVWIFDTEGSCSDEESFLVTVNQTPIITNPGNQTACDSYTLPTITGTNLTGNENYYNNSQALGGTVITGPITSTQTVWIFDTEGACSDEESFVVTINQTPIITNPGNQTACDSYTLPTISGTDLTGNENYYNNSQALGGTVITGPITSTQTVWIYDTEGTCSDEESFLVTVNQTPIITNPGNQTACDSYTLPNITGTNLTGNENYYNNSQALGGTVITGPITSTQTVWIYDTEGTCSDEESFLVTVNQTPIITNPGNQTACDSYTLPSITGTNLTGNQNYYNNSQALGGTVIAGPITSTQTVWIYDTEGSCSDEESFLVTVNQTPIITNPGNQTACDSYTLPTITGTNLTGNENYYNNSQALGGTVITGPITSTQTVWIFDTEGTCSDEESFLVTINQTPIITNPGNQTACDSYTLPTITGTNLTGNQNYYNNSQALGGTVITGPITSTQTVWIFDTEGSCSDEESFLVTVNQTPIITNPGNQTACDSYTLPTITGTNLTGNENYYNNSQALGGTVITGPITSTQTVWIFDTEGTCSDEESFLITINNTPTITNPGPQVSCNSFTLGIPLSSNSMGNAQYYNNSQALGGTVIDDVIMTTQTVWIYDYEGVCSDEESFLITINNSPLITNPGNQIACDSYTLPIITGSNLNGTQNYYNNSQALGGTVISGNITSTQTVWIYTSNGTCADEKSFLITINTTPTILFTPDKLNGCAPLTIVFNNNTNPNSDNVIWNFGDGTIETLSSNTETITHTFNQIGCFDIQLTSTTNGCTNTLLKSQYICTFETAIADFSSNKFETSLIDPTFTFINNSINAGIYTWDFGDESTSDEENPIHEYANQPDTYLVTLIANNSNNCPDSTTISVKVNDELVYFIPNSFTPDEDDVNKNFTPIFTSGFDPYNFELLIFNRWGQIVFESHDASIGWNGKMGVDGPDCQDGTYTWKIVFSENTTKKTKEIIGHVNLIR
jgi:gliding motility-associated-like protein